MIRPRPPGRSVRAELSQHPVRHGRVLDHAAAVDVVDALIGQGQLGLRIGHLQEAVTRSVDPVQREPGGREREGLFGHVGAEDAARAGLEEESDDVVPRPAAVVEDRLAVVVAPQVHQLRKEWVLAEAPLEELLPTRRRS